MPAFRASGRSGHALTTAARSGLSSGAGATTQTRVARRLREGPGTARLGHDEEIERSGFDVARIPEISGLSGLGRSDSEYRRWESNPHGRFRPEDFKSSASAIPPRRLLRRSIDRQEMPQKEKAGPARPVRDRRWSDSQSIGPERWNSNPRPARTSPRRTCTGVRALRRPRPRDPARRRCPCSDRAARPAFPDTCRPAVGRGKPPDSCLGSWRSRIPGCPTRRRGAA